MNYSKNAKIYSRTRLILPSFKNKKIENNYIKEKNNKIMKIAIIIILASITASIIIKSINPIINQLCINEAKNIATKISNEQATIIMYKYNYEDLITVSKDSENNIVMIQANASIINNIASDIPLKIIEEFKENTNSEINMYLGSILGLKTFSGAGPKIDAKIANTSNVETNLKSEFVSQGINQTLHKIYLEIKLDVSILTPYNVVNTSIVNQVLIAESIIVGNVPNSYYNLNGTNSNSGVNIMDEK